MRLRRFFFFAVFALLFVGWHGYRAILRQWARRRKKGELFRHYLKNGRAGFKSEANGALLLRKMIYGETAGHDPKTAFAPGEIPPKDAPSTHFAE